MEFITFLAPCVLSLDSTIMHSCDPMAGSCIHNVVEMQRDKIQTISDPSVSLVVLMLMFDQTKNINFMTQL